MHSIEIALTDRCNLRCNYCYQVDRAGIDASWDTVRAALDVLRVMDAPAVRLALTGGEPFLAWPRLRETVAVACAENPASRTLHLSITTNGTLLDEDAIAWLALLAFRVRLSFDGVRAAQDRRGPGTFDRLDAVVDQLVARLPGATSGALVVAMTLDADLVPHLAESVAYFLGKGVGDIRLAPSLYADPRWTDAHDAALHDELLRVATLSAAHFTATGTTPFAALRDLEQNTVRHEPCGAATLRGLFVDPLGQAWGCPCLATWSGALPPRASAMIRHLALGPIGSPALGARIDAARAWAKQSSFFRAPREHDAGRCLSCPAAGLCVVCPFSRAVDAGRTHETAAPNTACALTRALPAARAAFAHATLAPRARTDMRRALLALETIGRVLEENRGAATSGDAPAGGREA